MTSEETKTLEPGTMIAVAYGSRGTQIARVRAVTRTGRVEIDRFVASYGGVWHASKGAIAAAKVIGLAPETDPRVAQARACQTIKAAR